MPGKVNPSVPEMVNQVCFQVIGCDAAILAAADAGQLELNVMMPVIAWNALHATTHPRPARCACCDDRCVGGHRGRRGALPRAARSQHGGRHRAQPVHRLRRNGGDRQDVGRNRTVRSATSCASAVSCRTRQLDAILSPRGDDVAGRPGHKKGTIDGGESTSYAVAARRARVAGAGRATASSGSSTAAVPARGSGRARRARTATSWQRPDQIMDALSIGEGSVVADLGAGSGWFTIRLASRVGPNGMVYAEDIQPQMIQAIERRVPREDLRQNVIDRARHGRRSRAAGRRDRCGADRRRVSRDGAAGRAAPQRRARRSSPTGGSASSSSRRTAAGRARRWTSASIPSA